MCVFLRTSVVQHCSMNLYHLTPTSTKLSVTTSFLHLYTLTCCYMYVRTYVRTLAQANICTTSSLFTDPCGSFVSQLPSWPAPALSYPTITFQIVQACFFPPELLCYAPGPSAALLASHVKTSNTTNLIWGLCCCLFLRTLSYSMYCS